MYDSIADLSSFPMIIDVPVGWRVYVRKTVSVFSEAVLERAFLCNGNARKQDFERLSSKDIQSTVKPFQMAMLTIQPQMLCLNRHKTALCPISFTFMQFSEKNCRLPPA